MGLWNTYYVLGIAQQPCDVAMNETGASCLGAYIPEEMHIKE